MERKAWHDERGRGGEPGIHRGAGARKGRREILKAGKSLKAPAP